MNAHIRLSLFKQISPWEHNIFACRRDHALEGVSATETRSDKPAALPTQGKGMVYVRWYCIGLHNTMQHVRVGLYTGVCVCVCVYVCDVYVCVVCDSHQN